MCAPTSMTDIILKDITNPKSCYTVLKYVFDPARITRFCSIGSAIVGGGVSVLGIQHMRTKIDSWHSVHHGMFPNKSNFSILCANKLHRLVKPPVVPRFLAPVPVIDAALL